MRSKKLLAFLLAASMLVGTVFSGSYQAAASTEKESETSTQSESNWSGFVGSKENPLIADPSTANKGTTGVVPGSDTVSEKNSLSVYGGSSTITGGTLVTESSVNDVKVDLKKKGTSNKFDSLKQDISADTVVKVIIEMKGDSIVEANPYATMSFYTRAKINSMEKSQNKIVSEIEKKVLGGESLDVSYQYTWLVNGIAAEVPFGMIEEIEKIPGVEDVVVQAQFEKIEALTSDQYTVTDGIMIGREDTWADGYTGTGMKISVIDTGLDDDHQNFGPLSEDKLTEDSLTVEDIDAVVGQLNASKVYSNLSGSVLYRSTKVAYGFNYVDGSLVINHDKDTQGDHGTHVAGIAAANKAEGSEVVGVAPDAQLYIMKVFGKNGGAYTEDIVAAVEDSLILGADVVNMSLGSPAGFTSEADWIDRVYDLVATTNTVLAVAAGNSATSGSANMWGTDQNLTSNPDNSTISSPAIYHNATSIASVDNVASFGYGITVNGIKFGFQEGSNGVNAPFDSLAGQTLEYVMVDNFGMSIDDFMAAGVAGKVAVVSRGTTTFSSKAELAEAAGAIACIVYNNVSGEFGMDLTGGVAMIPTVSISLQSGEILKASAAAGITTFDVSAEKEAIPSPTAYRMSDFSSWGVTPDLRLEPELTGPGGNIYSTTDGGNYDSYSGTSMASPNVAGLMALVMQYVKANYELSDPEIHTLVNTLLMSTAEVLMYDEEIPYSPRSQGAGLANAFNAIKARAYLTVNGVDVPKAELFDDPDKTGVYTYKFNVNGFGNEETCYSISTNAQTEGVVEYEGLEGITFMSSTPVGLGADITYSSDALILRYDVNEDDVTGIVDAAKIYRSVIAGETPADSYRYNLNNDEVVSVDDAQEYLNALVGLETEADLEEEILVLGENEVAEVEVTVTLDEESKEYMDTYFENGIYVEGFTSLVPFNGDGITLGLPYMGFYGDWTKAPLLDSGYYYQPEEEMISSQYYNIIWTNFQGSDDTWIPGTNPYVEEPIDFNNISFSPNGDGYLDYVSDIYVSLLRNSKDVSFQYVGEDGTVYFESNTEYVPKSVYSAGAGVCLPFVYSWYNQPYLFADETGMPLANNTKLNLVIKTSLDYDKHESNNVSDTWITPITIDTEAPVLDKSSVKFITEDGRNYVELTVSDNVDVAGVNFLNETGTVLYAQYAPEGYATTDAPSTQRYDITGFGNKIMVVLGDYCANESSYFIETVDNLPRLDESLLYGYRVYDAEIYDDSLFGWVAIDPETGNTLVLNSEYYMDYAITAADFVGGYIIASGADNVLYAIKPGLWDQRIRIAELPGQPREMAYDETTGMMYAYSTRGMFWGIDIMTGEVTDLSSYVGGMIISMAVTEDGTIYVIDNNAALRTMNKETWTLNDEVLFDTYTVTGNYPYYAQSMTYDKEANALYWAAHFQSYTGGAEGTLYRIDLTEGYPMTKIGTIAGNAEIVGLYKMDDKGVTLPEVSVESVTLKETQIALLVDGSKRLTASYLPWYATVSDLIWTSSDESVAVVDEDGLVTATGVGNAVITVQVEGTDATAECTVAVVSPETTLYGYNGGGENLYNQWVKIDSTDTEGFETLTEESFNLLYAGEYYDGNIYAYTAAGAFVKIDAETYELTEVAGAMGGYTAIDMAYDYSEGFMYVLLRDTMMGDVVLGQVDLLTGTLDIVDYLMDPEYGTPSVMAITTDGTFYFVSNTGMLYTYDRMAYEWTKIGFTGYAPAVYVQSMTYDHVNGGLYWAMISTSNEFKISYVDMVSGAALPLGTVDGGSQITALYTIPEEIPAREEVGVEYIDLKNEFVGMIEESSISVPVVVRPFNATNRDVTWSVEDETIVSIEGSMMHGLSVGTTTVTATLGEMSVSFAVKVLASAGELRGYVLADLATMDGYFWGSFDDRDLSKGEGINGDTAYEFHAGEYYNGKVYATGVDMETWDSVFAVIDATTYEVESAIVSNELPDVRDMAFDYSTGTMYAVGGVRNTYGNTSLYAVDITTGTFYQVGKFEEDSIIALACTTDGQLYGVSENGTLYAVDSSTAALSYIMETGYVANQYQSMAFDHNTGNLYWAQMGNDPMTWQTDANLLVIDIENYMVLNLGKIGMTGCQVVGLHIIPDHEIVIEEPAVEFIMLGKSSELLRVGESVQISASAGPVSVIERSVEYTYTSSDETIATVDANGQVTGVSAGKAIITVACGDVTAECVVNVADESKKVFAMNSEGYEVSPLLYPNKIDETISIPNGCELSISTVAYNPAFEMFFAFDAENNLWCFDEGFEYVECLGQVEIPMYNDEIFIRDITFNAFTGQCYILVHDAIDTFWGEHYIYELDVVAMATTGAVNLTMMELNRPVEIVCTSATDVVVYDAYDDYTYTVDLTQPYSAKQFIWVQGTFASTDLLGLVYSREYDTIFMAGIGTSYSSGTIDMALYTLSFDGKINKYADAAYADGMTDLALIEIVEEWEDPIEIGGGGDVGPVEPGLPDWPGIDPGFPMLP